MITGIFFFFSSRRRHTRCYRDWSSDVCSSDLGSQTYYVIAGKSDVLIAARSERLRAGDIGRSWWWNRGGRKAHRLRQLDEPASDLIQVATGKSRDVACRAHAEARIGS